MTNEAQNSAPDNFDPKRLMPAAKLLVGEFTTRPISDEALLNELDRLMNSGKQLWGCFSDRLLTEEELFNGLASRIISFALSHEPPPHTQDQCKIAPHTRRAIEVALFGTPKGFGSTTPDEHG